MLLSPSIADRGQLIRYQAADLAGAFLVATSNMVSPSLSR
jgi:hypothetical protein